MPREVILRMHAARIDGVFIISQDILPLRPVYYPAIRRVPRLTFYDPADGVFTGSWPFVVPTKNLTRLKHVSF